MNKKDAISIVRKGMLVGEVMQRLERIRDYADLDIPSELLPDEMSKREQFEMMWRIFILKPLSYRIDNPNTPLGSTLVKLLMEFE